VRERTPIHVMHFTYRPWSDLADQEHGSPMIYTERAGVYTGRDLYSHNGAEGFLYLRSGVEAQKRDSPGHLQALTAGGAPIEAPCPVATAHGTGGARARWVLRAGSGGGGGGPWDCKVTSSTEGILSMQCPGSSRFRRMSHLRPSLGEAPDPRELRVPHAKARGRRRDHAIVWGWACWCEGAQGRWRSHGA
jgi:hypothetical protein